VPVAQVVSMKQLLESGVHFGHQTRRWNPKMKRYIFTERNGIYIIDLQQSLDYIDRAYEFIKETVAHGGTILYVGTKKQAQEAIAEQARRVGMPFVNQRWLGGMLTNFSTVYKRLQRLKELEELDFNDVAGSGMTKKELLHLRREHDKLDRTLGGIRDMARVPSAIWVVDTKKEHIAVSEARKLGIPVVAILDTNCDPDEVNYPIPGNDDAIRSVALLTRVVADAVAEGLIARAGAAGGDEKPSGDQLGSEEPLAEWERELLVGAQADSAGGVDGRADSPAPADTPTVAAAVAEAAPEINAESAITSDADAAADEADDLAAIADAAGENETVAATGETQTAAAAEENQTAAAADENQTAAAAATGETQTAAAADENQTAAAAATGETQTAAADETQTAAAAEENQTAAAADENQTAAAAATGETQTAAAADENQTAAAADENAAAAEENQTAAAADENAAAAEENQTAAAADENAAAAEENQTAAAADENE
jgi:ribosomal protein S2